MERKKDRTPICLPDPGALRAAGLRMLALDLDGTLLTDDKRLTAPTAKALREAAAAGLEIVVVTGRPLSGLSTALPETLPGVRYVISSNGAVTTDLRTGKTLRAALLPPETAKAVAALPAQRALVYTVFAGGIGLCTAQTLEQMLSPVRGTPLEPYIRSSRRSVLDLPGCIDASHGAENIWIVASDRTERDALNRRILARWNVRTVLTAQRDIEVGAPEADKGLALSALAEMLGMERSGILALGDNENDLGMFRAAGISVAMGNAAEEIRAAADYVTGSNAQDGAAAVISLAAKSAAD